MEFVNDIGQTIVPGDDVVIVTTGYGHSVNTYRGTFLGLNKSGRAQCVKKVKTSWHVFKDTNERVPYSFFQEKYRALADFRTKHVAQGGNSYGYYNAPEYKKIEEEYNSKIERVQGIVDRRTTLQLNRVYKLAA